jgi:sugar O-acyltransferase (sialic acid O-acetyltransferase NeuD family)
MSNDVLVIGAGGHASVLLEMLIAQGTNVIGYISPLPAVNQKLFSDFHWFKCDDDILQFDKSNIKLVNGIGSLPGNTLRADFYSKYKKAGYCFETVVSRHAFVSKYAELAEGVQIMCGAIVQTGVSVGCNSIINTGAIIDHDASIGSNNHIAPGVTISGQVTSKENVHFGTGCSVIQLIKINENAVIGAGATITKNIESNAVCYPAHIFKKIME